MKPKRGLGVYALLLGLICLVLALLMIIVLESGTLFSNSKLHGYAVILVGVVALPVFPLSIVIGLKEIGYGFRVLRKKDTQSARWQKLPVLFWTLIFLAFGLLWIVAFCRYAFGICMFTIAVMLIVQYFIERTK